jgi:hypothetical protein
MSEITPRWRPRPHDHRRLVGWQGGEGLVLGLLRGADGAGAGIGPLAMAGVVSQPGEGESPPSLSENSQRECRA